MKNYYVILGVERNTHERQIRRITYRKARLIHPSKNQSDETKQGFIELIEAYNILHDRILRETYHWILDHEGGESLLPESVLEKHKKNIAKAASEGIQSAIHYAESPYREFKDDFRPSSWWSWVDWLPFVGLQ